MKMLGNSAQGLSADNKRALYRSCVIPIMTYGSDLWFFDGTRVKGLLDQLRRTQYSAGIWITGAFHTSP